MNFLRYYIHFDNPEMITKFEQEISILTKGETTMGIEEFLLNQAKSEGIEQGFEQGIEKGEYSLVFINGKHIPYVATDAQGTTQSKEQADGYCHPFSFDITAALAPGHNSIALLCTRSKKEFNELGTGRLLGPPIVYRKK